MSTNIKTTKIRISEDRLNILIPKGIKDDYKIYCIKNNLNLSKRLRELIEMDMKNLIQK